MCVFERMKSDGGQRKSIDNKKRLIIPFSTYPLASSFGSSRVLSLPFCDIFWQTLSEINVKVDLKYFIFSFDSTLLPILSLTV